MVEASTSSAVAQPVEMKESLILPKYPSCILKPFFRYTGTFRTKDVKTASTSVTLSVQASLISFDRSLIPISPE